MEQEIIDKVKRWISDFVIGLNLCPFADHPFRNDNINYVVTDYVSDQQLLASFNAELEVLADGDISTSLIVINDNTIGFLEYLRIFDLCETSLADAGRSEQFQLASFHPDYQFADSDYADQSNFSNRSPFPIIHILRTKEVTDAIAAYGDTSLIYKRNIETLENLPTEKLLGFINN